MNAAQLIEGHEGRRRTLYRCSAGYNTIGIGHNLDANAISDRAVDVIFEDDLAEVERQLDAHLPWWRTEDTVRQAALLDLCFNLGILKLLTFEITLENWRLRFYTGAARGLENSKWFTQVGRRGPRIVGMVRTGEWPR